MEHQKADTRQVTSCGASGDDAARFLRELRQLRAGAGLGHAELAARAHYPYDSIRAAEVGPALPDLPVLSAYVRGCGGTAEEWEERWRSLTRSPSLPVPAARHVGNSPAATAGARINAATSHDGDAPDPSIIIAALDRVAEEMAGGDDTDRLPPAAGDQPPAVQAADVRPSAAQPTAAPPPADVPPPAVQPRDVQPRDVQPSADVPPEPFATPAAPPFSPAEPPAGGKPAGWDPIRVSSAWPAIPASSGAGSPSGNTARAGDAGPARVTSPRTRTVVIAAIVLLCVLAVLLAIFA